MLLLALGCGSPPPGDRPPPPHSVATTGVTAATGDTGGATAGTATTGAPPATLAATCEPTDNALRFLCRVTVDPPQPVQVRYARADGAGAERVARGPDALAEHELVLVFLPEETEHAWTAATDDPEGPVATGGFTTGRVPDVARASLSVSGTPGTAYLGTHQPCNGSSIATVFETTTGAQVWYQALDAAGRFGFLDMVSFTEDHTVLGETGASIVEVDLAGRTLLRLERGVDYTEEFHHDVVKRAGFVYAIYVDPATRNPQLDAFAVFDATTGVRVADWRAREHLDLPPDASGDWMHTNTVWVGDDGDVLLSSYGQDTLVEVEGDWTAPDFGAPRWAMAGHAGTGLGDDITLDWAPVGDEDSFAHQHHAHFVDPGHLLMLDNVHGRGLLVAVDEAARTGAVERAFDTGEVFCGPQGTSAMTASGHVLVGCSADGALRDYDPAGQLAWSARAECETALFSTVARYTPLDGW